MKPFHYKLTASLIVLAGPFGLFAGEPTSNSEAIDINSELVDRLMLEAQGRNPAVQAAGARADAAHAAVAGVRTWDDPTASFGLWASSSRGFSSSEQGNLVYGLEQRLPLYGRPDLQRKVAASDASKEELASEFVDQKLRRDLTVALIGVALSDREAEVAEQELSWLDATLEAVDHRYRVGQASQVDWLKIQTARALATDDVKTREHEREHGAFALNRILNREFHAHWPKVTVPALQPALYYTPQLVDAVLAGEPQLKVMRQESLSAQAAADLTRRQRLPDVSVGLEARQYSGDGGFREGTATVSFTVPWLNKDKYDSDWRRDQHRKRASDFAATDYSLSVREELHHNLVNIDAARRRAVLFKDQLIPLTQQTLASAQTAWEHNIGQFQDILDAHRMLLTDEIELARSLSEQGTLLAEISLLTGSRDLGSLFALAGNPAPDHDDPISVTSK